MERSEIEARKYFGILHRIGRMPRKRKKVVKKAIKLYIEAQIDCGNWDAMDYMNTHGLWPTNKENSLFGGVNLIN